MARSKAAKYVGEQPNLIPKEPDCSICHVPWPDNPGDEEYIEIRAIWREHVLALTGSRAVREHVKTWAMWRGMSEPEAEVEAREWSRSWHTRKFLADMGTKYEPEREDGIEQAELREIEMGEPQGPLAAAAANLVESYVAGYINSRNGKPIDPHVIARMQEEFTLGRQEALRGRREKGSATT
jgi:hypothetical protein